MSKTTDPGEKSLSSLLATLTTILHPEIFVFTTHQSEATLPALSSCRMVFHEIEGTTAIITQSLAEERRLDYLFPSRMITLNVTSSLEAVGFMAVVATRLAEKQMGVNPVSGFFHDHLFVPVGREEEALRVLKDVAKEKREEVGEGSV